MSTTWRRGISPPCTKVVSASAISWAARTCGLAPCSRISRPSSDAARRRCGFPSPRSTPLPSAPNGLPASPENRHSPPATGCAWRATTCSSMTPRRGVSLAIVRVPTGKGSPTPSSGSSRRDICSNRHENWRYDEASMRGLLALAQEAEELDAFAQPPSQDLGTPDHFTGDRGNLGCTEIEAFVELVHRLENLGVTEMLVAQ